MTHEQTMHLTFVVLRSVIGAIIGFSLYKWAWHRGAAHAYQDTAELLKDHRLPSYSIAADGKSITCRMCGMTSHNINNVRHKYCGMCHVFHEGPGGRPPK